MAAPTEVVGTLAGLNASLSLPLPTPTLTSHPVLAVAASEGAAFMPNEAVDPGPGLPALQYT